MFSSLLSGNKKEVSAAYFVNWGIYGRNFHIAHIDAAKLTHILYAFADVKTDGSVALTDAFADIDKHFDPALSVDGKGDSWNDVGKNLYGNFKQLYLLKKKHRHLKVTLSVGGWTLSTNFPVVAASPSARSTFVKTSVKLLDDLGLDGIDIDWEYPKSDADARNYVALLSDLRKGLNDYAASKGDSPYLLTAAMPCGKENYTTMHLHSMNDYLDYFYLMAYDYSGSWASVAEHQSNLHGGRVNTEKAIRYYLNQTIPSHKLVIGMPMYGRSFAATDGLNHPYQGVGGGTWEQGVYDYKSLPQPGAQEKHDWDSVASWSYDPAKRELVTYDSAKVVDAKCQYIRKHRLGGTMFWELSGDARDESKSLLSARYKASGSHLDDTHNHLNFPGSIYDNVRAKMN